MLNQFCAFICGTDLYLKGVLLVHCWQTNLHLTVPEKRKMTNPLIERYLNMFKSVNYFVALST